MTLPAGEIAYVVHTGPHESLALALFPLMAWLHERELRPRGHVLEHYLDDPDDVALDALRTEVAVPITDPGGSP